MKERVWYDRVMGPEEMREAMAGYVRAVHEAYLNAAKLVPRSARARLPLLAGPFTVVAAGVTNLHVVATREPLPAPEGPEVEVADETGSMRWTLRFFDPVVEPALGMVDESAGAAGAEVRRILGLVTYLYHLVVAPGAALGPHHAGHAGTGLANAHAAWARDLETLRALVPTSRLGLVDELEGATSAGLVAAQGLLARELAPDDPRVADAAAAQDPERLRRALLDAYRKGA